MRLFKASLVPQAMISMRKCGCCNKCFNTMNYMRWIIIISVFASGTLPAHAQERKTENLLIIGWDGVRWEEIFTGVDSAILNDRRFTREPGELRSLYWSDTPEARRKKLFPFFWGAVEQNGQLYGNRDLGNKVDVSNKWHITRVGFTETLIGFADPAVNSNRSVAEKNTNSLEFINNQPAYKGKVAVFATSKLFDSILNVKRSGLIINCDSEEVALPGGEFRLLNEEQRLSPRVFGERLDLVTYFQAREYVKEYHPRVMYINFSEPDNYAHAGSYDWYISTVHGQERLIADLWNYIQSIPQYKGKTTLLIAPDHGRGRTKDRWTEHGPYPGESKEIFILAMGPDMPALGEVKTGTQLYQGQIAATIAKLLGFDYTAEHPVLPVITTMAVK
jgi:hypothetical protein